MSNFVRGKYKTGLGSPTRAPRNEASTGRLFHHRLLYYTPSGPHQYYMDDGKVERVTVDYHTHHDQTDNYLANQQTNWCSNHFNEKRSFNATKVSSTYGYGYYKHTRPYAARWLNTSTQRDRHRAGRPDPRKRSCATTWRRPERLGGSSVKNLDHVRGVRELLPPHWGVLDWVDGLDKSQTGTPDNDVDTSRTLTSSPAHRDCK